VWDKEKGESRVYLGALYNMLISVSVGRVEDYVFLKQLAYIKER